VRAGYFHLAFGMSGLRFLSAPVLVAAFFAGGGALRAQELVLAVDVSGSMQYAELQLQRDGYVAAFRSPEIDCAIGEKLQRANDNRGRPEKCSGYHQLLAVGALLLRRFRIDLAVAFGEMRRGDEAAGDRHLDDRHRRLDQQVAGAVEPDF